MNPHFKALEAAYQLHYYLYFKTHYLKPTLADPRTRTLVDSVFEEVCAREHYSLLERSIDENHLRLLISLRPQHTVSDVVKKLKGNLQHQYLKEHSEKLLGKGYFARTSGRVSVERTNDYLNRQVTHHGYRGEWTDALELRNTNFRSPAFSFGHCVSILNYHLVLSTQERKSVFDEEIAPKLFNYICRVGTKHDFLVERVSFLPDHMHMTFEGKPTISAEDYALMIMNNTQFWMNKYFSGVLKNTDAWNVWEPTYYAGTVGEYTTAQVKSFLNDSTLR